MQTRIKFIAHGANSLIGGFIAGDEMRCGTEIAAHLVECGVAVFIDAADFDQNQPEKRIRKRKEK